MFCPWKGLLHAVLILTKPDYHLLISSIIIYHLLLSIVYKYHLLITMAFVAHSYRDTIASLYVSDFVHRTSHLCFYSHWRHWDDATLCSSSPTFGAGDEKSKRDSELDQGGYGEGHGRNPGGGKWEPLSIKSLTTELCLPPGLADLLQLYRSSPSAPCCTSQGTAANPGDP